MNDTQPLSPEALSLKCALDAALAKEGHSLQELEQALAQQDTEKTAALLKLAKDGESWVDGITDLAKLFGGTALLTGGVAGGGLYGAYKGLKHSEKKVKDSDALRQRIDLARRELEAQLQHPQYV